MKRAIMGWLPAVMAACTSTQSVLDGLPDADGGDVTVSNFLAQANGFIVGTTTLAYAAPRAWDLIEPDPCQTRVDERPVGPVRLDQDCTTDDQGVSTRSTQHTIVDAPLADYVGLLGVAPTWPLEPGTATNYGSMSSSNGYASSLEAQVEMDVDAATMTLSTAFWGLMDGPQHIGRTKVAARFDGTFRRLSDNVRHVQVDGGGGYGDDVVGKVTFETRELVFDPNVCANEPLSGTTEVTTPQGTIVYTYDGAEDCGDDDDGDGTQGPHLIPWTGPAGSGEGMFSFCSQGVSPTTWGGALFGLLALGLRRRRHEDT